MSEPKIKGATVREFCRWFTHRTKRDTLRRAFDALPPGTRALFDLESESLGVLASSWYDSARVGELVDALVRTIPPAQRDQAVRDAARFAVDVSARGVYKYVLSVLSPELYAQNIQRLWNMVHDSGTREIVIDRPGHARSVTREWRGHHPVLCTGTVVTLAAILEILGCREARAQRVSCVSDGARECVAEVTWSVD